MRVMLPKPMKYLKTSLEMRHERALQAQSLHGPMAKPKRFRNAVGRGLQTVVLHASGETLVRTYDDGETEVVSMQKTTQK